MSYYDGFVAAVPTANRDVYASHARKAWDDMFAPAGAVGMVETWGEEVPEGELTSFPKAVQCKSDESIVFSWIEWPDRATRDAAWSKMMEDPGAMQDMPFDGKRMIYGGFAPIVSVRA
ncbi:DUF1428 domain-containing protein [Jannaschia sp. W003]|uniref:DUF1428 domain-containing protein n=1 Tax=Jannaschia sp. W003 TaxID=2867012 RepID=UPI0021A45CD1|nr:DUF1428 domain-containing protein [Jannaschia sp. W003]UWQ22697.1 DUF1428 domain-containing protein [Jannaschia sp. W003]